MILQLIQSISHISLQKLAPHTTHFFTVILPLINSHFDEYYPPLEVESVTTKDISSVSLNNKEFWDDYDPSNEEDVEDAYNNIYIFSEDIPDFQVGTYDIQTQYLYLILILESCYQSVVNTDYIESFQDFLEFSSDYMY